MNNSIVIKFGGTSVSSLEKWLVISDTIKKHVETGFRVFFVHSAANGITDRLQILLKHKQDQIIEEIKHILQQLATDLNVSTDILNTEFEKLDNLLQLPQPSLHQQAEILAWGEVATHQLGLAFLQQSIPVTSLDPKHILISSAHDNRNNSSRVLSAKCDVTKNQTLIDSFDQSVYSMPGFVASDPQQNTVVLGRSGSDTSAAYLAVLVNAERLEIWTDVHGIFSANPHAIPTARLLETIGYQEAREIAASGGKVLHPRSILPVEQNNIPLHIKYTQQPDAAGTVLGHQYSSTAPRVRAISTRHNITLISMESMSMWHQAGFLGSVFDIYKQLGFSVDLISTAQTNVTVSLDTADNIIEENSFNTLVEHLSRVCQVEVFKNCSAVTLVGYRIRALADKIAPVISSFADQRIYMITQSSKDLNQTIVVDQDQADKLTRALHDVLITQAYQPEDFGPTWQELVKGNSPQPQFTPPWWQSHRMQLLKLSEQKTPCYVYHMDTIQQQIDHLKSIRAVDKIHYACKANAHPDILRLIHANGLGLETVSPGEINRVMQAIPEIAPDEILFTPNFAPKQEYIDASRQGLNITIDNLFILQHWASDLADTEVILRLDPGHGSGHHRYVRTAGEHSKFGIHHSELEQAAMLCKQHNITVKGIHAHSGSGILNYENWQRIIQYLTDQLNVFPDAYIVNIGGGMGIRENPGDAGLNLQALDEMLLEFKQRHPHIHIWIEPGRYLVAHAGILMAKVTQTKWKNSKGYIGVETGMNSLIRPALYGAWHNIVNLSKFDQPNTCTASIVGPMCESGDILGVDREMPETQYGDVLMIANTGAYSASMASQYNLRQPATEIIF
ncbi:bifunctional aspartate kinase/diaminopimelate decarboxylase [Marinicella sp. W31]|uniref:bifunctional aspartate kinase/diaminopimelate decarboxylase n=1 Tax=Marinicella sp. W31 TaxID=3023713 RepID=UPI003757C4B3